MGPGALALTVSVLLEIEFGTQVLQNDNVVSVVI